MRIIEVSMYNARIVAFLTKDNTLVKYNGTVVNCGSFNAMKRYMKLNGYTNPRDYELAIQFYNKENRKLEYIMYSDLQEVNNKVYQGFHKETNELIQFEFEDTEKVTSLRYLVFDHGDEVRLEINNSSSDRSKYLMSIVRKAISNMMKNGDYIDRYCIDKYSTHTKINIKGCQESIYICHNYQLIHTNQLRKKRGTKCLPFDKNMDKFLTIYIYSTTEYVPGTLFEERYKEFLNVLMENIKEIYNSDVEDNPKYKEVKFFAHLYV